jgi:hypothetical protein
MAAVTPPGMLADYNMSVIHSLLNKRHIESETFDFKGKEAAKGSELSKDFCAMANTSGGIIVLGIDEVKKKGVLIGFTKNGFRTNVQDEDKVNQVIGSSRYEIEPNPILESKPIFEDTDPTIYYMVLRIDGREIYRPYFVRNSWQCYIRVGNTSRPASRSVVMNLFSGFVERRTSARKLVAYTAVLKEELINVSSALDEAGKYWSEDSIHQIAPLNLSMFRISVAESFWLLSEKGLMGGHVSANPNDKYNFNSYMGGVNGLLRDIELLNSYIKNYNQEKDPEVKANIIHYIGDTRFWKPKRDSIIQALGYCDNILHAANDFLYKTN